jgi:MFS family permease
LEVITKHRTEPIMRPEAIVKRIPSELSNIVLKMVAKRPEDRFQTMGEVIRTLEHFLGVQSTGPFSPREEHASTLENCLAKFNNAPLAKIRNLVIPSFLVGCVGLSAVLLFLSWWWLSAVLGLTAAAAVAYFVTGGTSSHNYFFDKIRSYIFAQSIGEWITNIGSILLSAAIIWLLGWTVPFVSGAVLGACLGVAGAVVFDKRLLASRRESIEAMESLLKSLRMKGVEEDAIEQFVVKYSGDQWEEFYETIFGYEAMLRARTELSRSEQGRRRHKFATWRDGIIKSIDAKLTAQREARDRKHLQKVEEDNLKAQGIDASRAKEEAAAMAAAQVEAAAEVRALPTEKTQTALNLDDPRLIAAQKRDRQLQMLAEARGGKRRQERGENFLISALRGPLAFLFGAKVRFLLGAALMAAFIYWLNLNGILGELDKTVSSGIDASTQEAAEKVATSIFNKFYNVMLDPNKLQPLPFPIVGGLLSHFGTGVAGLSLLILGLFSSWRVSFFAVPAAAIAVFVVVFMPSMMLIGYGIAAGLTVAGVLIGRNME